MSSWDTSQVTNMSEMFKNTHSLERLDLGSKSKFNDDVDLPAVSGDSPLTGSWIRVDPGSVEAPGVTSWTGSSDELIAHSRTDDNAGTYVWHYENSVVYDGNASDASGSVTGSDGVTGVAHDVASAGFERPGFKFIGWNTALCSVVC